MKPIRSDSADIKASPVYLDCDLDTDLAWDIITGNSSVVIAILDTGVDLDHPDLVENIVSGYNFVNDSLPPDDEFDHGTPCAGIAAATMNNDIGISGVCPDCSLMSVKVLNDDGSGDWGIGPTTGPIPNTSVLLGSKNILKPNLE